MISPSEFKNGTAIKFKEETWVIVDFQHVNPGKGSSFVRTRLKNLKSNKVVEHTFKVVEKVEEADVSYKHMQFLYADDSTCNFMDNNTYEQVSIDKELIGDKAKYLLEGSEVDVVFVAESPVNINLPKKMDYKVTEAPDGVKGDSATNATKTVVLENGLNVFVPLFIKEGETIRINTETGDYVERVNK